MSQRTWTALFVLLFLFVLSGRPAWSGGDSILVAKGIEKIQSRAFDEAIDLLSQALALNPDDPEAHYFMGYACVRLGRYEKAEKYLLTSLEKDPSATEAYFELGVLASHLARCEQAKKYFSLFSDRSTDETLKQAAEDFLKGCGKGVDQERMFRLNVSLGGQYDTNVILEPSNPQRAGGDKSDFRGLLFLSAGATPLRNEVASIHVDYDLYQSAHTDQNDFNLTYNRLSPTVDFFPMENLEPSVGYVFEHSFLKWDSYGMAHKVFARVRVLEGERFSTTGSYEYANVRYWDTDLFPSNEDRSGHRNTVECRQRFETERVDFDLVGSGDLERARRGFWSYNGFRLGAASGIRLLPSLHLGLDAGYTERRYRADDPTANRGRHDRAFDGTVMITYLLTDKIGITVSNNTTVNDSNISRYKYQRNVTGIFVTVGIL